MSPVLLLPVGLAALAALALPLLVHLARREENRPLDFAALRWLEQRPRPRSRVRFDERLLLAVRLLLLTLLALWLAQPALVGRTSGGGRVLIVPGADRTGAPAGARWLAPGFPRIDAAMPTQQQPVASLLRQAEAELPPGTRLTVLAPPVIDGQDAERPRLSRPVDWRIVHGAASLAGPISADMPPRLAIRVARAGDARILAAVARAWRPQELSDIADPSAPLPARGSVLAWLAPGPLPEEVRRWVESGGTALLAKEVLSPEQLKLVTVWSDPIGRPLLEAAIAGRGRVLRFARPLTIPAMPLLAEPDFPRRLRDLIAPPPAPARAFARDVAPQSGGTRYPSPAEPLGPWLGVLVAAAFLLERWLATGRRRTAA